MVNILVIPLGSATVTLILDIINIDFLICAYDVTLLVILMFPISKRLHVLFETPHIKTPIQLNG